MKRLQPDPTQFKAKLGSKLKRKPFSSPAASSTSKKQKERPTKESSGTGPQPVKSPTPQSESTPAPSPRPSQPLETAFSDPPASSILTGSQAKEKEIAVEPFRAREHFEAPRAEFPRAQEFAHSVHEALLDLPLAEEVDYASRSTNLLRYQSEVRSSQILTPLTATPFFA